MNENLTPQIVAALLQDGTIKMTGEEIATAIADAVGGLEKQYRFLGVATPELAPGNIQTPTLYVAVMDATYPSFSGQSVDNGQIAFFTSDDGAYWDMALAYNPQPEPGPGPSPTPSTGLKVIVSTADWNDISSDGEEVDTLSALAALTGISESDLDEMFNSTVPPFIILSGIGTNYFCPPTTFDVEGGKITDVVWFFPHDENHPEFEIYAAEGKYYAFGFGVGE